MRKLEHVGIAVADADRTATILADLLGVTRYKTEEVEREGVTTHFIAAGTAKLELLSATSLDSPIARHIEKRGEGLHHLAFEVDDVDSEITRLRDRGFRPLSDNARDGADDKRIVFFHPKDTAGILIELCESKHSPPANESGPIIRWAQSSRQRLVILAGTVDAKSTIVLGNTLEASFDVTAVEAGSPHAVASALLAHPTNSDPIDIVMLPGSHADEPELALVGGNTIASIFMINPATTDISSARALASAADQVQLVFGGSARREDLDEGLSIARQDDGVTCCILPAMAGPLDVGSARLLANYLLSITAQE